MDSQQKGKNYENHVASLLRKKLDKKAKRNKGSGAQWNRRNDIWTDLPIAVECKYQGTVKIHDWFKQAEAAASYTQVPMVVFANENHPEDLVVLKWNDLLNYLVEITDLQAENHDLQQPITTKTKPSTSAKVEEATNTVAKIAERKVKEEKLRTCREGHILMIGRDKCSWKGCKYSAGYKPKKEKKK